MIACKVVCIVRPINRGAETVYIIVFFVLSVSILESCAENKTASALPRGARAVQTLDSSVSVFVFVFVAVACQRVASRTSPVASVARASRLHVYSVAPPRPDDPTTPARADPQAIP